MAYHFIDKPLRWGYHIFVIELASKIVSDYKIKLKGEIEK